MTEEEIKEMLDREHLEEAERLSGCGILLERYIRCLRGEEEDLTGIGMWQMFCHALEKAKGVRVVPDDRSL